MDYDIDQELHEEIDLETHEALDQSFDQYVDPDWILVSEHDFSFLQILRGCHFYVEISVHEQDSPLDKIFNNMFFIYFKNSR